MEKIQKSLTSVTLHPSRQTIMATKKESQINATIANMPSLRQAIWDYIWNARWRRVKEMSGDQVYYNHLLRHLKVKINFSLSLF